MVSKGVLAPSPPSHRAEGLVPVGLATSLSRRAARPGSPGEGRSEFREVGESCWEGCGNYGNRKCHDTMEWAWVLLDLWDI